MLALPPLPREPSGEGPDSHSLRKVEDFGSVPARIGGWGNILLGIVVRRGVRGVRRGVQVLKSSFL